MGRGAPWHLPSGDVSAGCGGYRSGLMITRALQLRRGLIGFGVVRPEDLTGGQPPRGYGVL